MTNRPRDLICRLRNATLFAAALLGILAGPGHCRAEAEGQPFRTGLWTTQRLPEDDASMQAFAKDLGESRFLSGVCLHIPWNAIEKESGKPNFTSLDRAIQILREKKMKYQLCFKPGASTPSFVYAQGAQSFSTSITNPYRRNTGAEVTIPVPWDPVYQRDFSRMITSLGNRYASDPLCVCVVLTCANYLSAEMHLPRTRSDLAKWALLGNYQAKLLDTYKKYTDEWALAFPQQEVSLHVSKVLDLPPGFCERVIDNGLNKYPRRFSIQNCQLTGRREDTGRMTYDLVQKYRDRVHHGFQSLAGLSDNNERMGSIEMATLNVVHGKGEYWELWRGDGFNPGTCEAISKAWEEATHLGYQAYKEKLVSEGKYRQ